MKTIRGSLRYMLPSNEPVAVEKLALTILSRRGLSPAEQSTTLVPRYADLGDPFLLPDMDVAVRQLLDDRQAGRLVAIYGDYDIDGLTASSLLADIFTDLGIRFVLYIPDRFEEGYGLSNEAFDALAAQGVATVVSVDCGSTALEPAQHAQELGLKLIITDHHTIVQERLPGALAHINPLRTSSRYPEKSLAGVGVAFALARALQQRLPDGEYSPGREKWLLDLVALGTICDVVPLVGENRILAHFGLQVMRKTRRKGLRALAKVSGFEIEKVQAEQIGFRIGPRLNAAGRLEHAQRALDLLTSQATAEAAAQADYLQQLNTARQDSTKMLQAAARAQALEYPEDSFLVLADPDWSHGIVGLAAARISEEFRCPTLVLQIEGDTAKGSARSFGSISVIDALQSQANLLIKFGGHRAAAGCTLKTVDIPSLRAGLQAFLKKTLKPTDWLRSDPVDVWLLPEHATDRGIAELEQLEPTGQALRPAKFVCDAEITQVRAVGATGDHFQITIMIGQKQYRMIAFGAAQKWPDLAVGQTHRFIVQLSQSEWQGVKRVELMVVDIIPQDESL